MSFGHDLWARHEIRREWNNVGEVFNDVKSGEWAKAYICSRVIERDMGARAYVDMYNSCPLE